MATHWLRNYYHYKRQLNFDDETGAYEEHDGNQMSEEDLAPRPGAWIEKHDHVFGICPTTNGPVFFRDDRQFLLKEGSTTTALDDAGAKKRFVLTVEGQTVVDFTFEPDPDEELNVFTGDQDEFFEWLTYLARQPHFWDLFTT